MARIQAAEAERFLADVPDQYVFRCHDSCVMRNIKELRDALEGMSDDVFLYHANDEKNDFSNWIKDIIGDATLARQIARAHDRTRAMQIVDERIDFLSSKLP